MLELREYQDEISSKAAQLLEQDRMCFSAMEGGSSEWLAGQALAFKDAAESVRVLLMEYAVSCSRSALE